MELARLRNGNRSGPYEYFQWGKYNHRKVTDIIKEDPMYIMVSVKDWLYLSPSQAELFLELYEGEIPENFIREFPSKEKILSRRENIVSSSFSGTDSTKSEQYSYETNKDIKPNLEFQV